MTALKDAQPRNSFTWANPLLLYRNLARQKKYCSIVGVPMLSVFFKSFFTYTVTEDFNKLAMFKHADQKRYFRLLWDYNRLHYTIKRPKFDILFGENIFFLQNLFR